MMKKTIVSFVFIAAFAAYALYRAVGSSDASASTISTVPTTVPVTTSQNPTPTATTPTPTPTPTPTGKYKDGSYTGSVADAFYGNLQVKAIISGGKLTDVQFLQYPSDRDHSVEINSQAMPLLKQEAIAVQSANVDIVSGATQSSVAFQESLGAALSQAKS